MTRLRIDVPPHWTDAAVTERALTLYDVAFTLGSVVHYSAWKRHFTKPGTTEANAARTWERFKHNLKQMKGLKFDIVSDLDNTSTSNREDEKSNGLVRHSLVFESTQHMFDAVEALIGPAIFESEVDDVVAVV